MFFFTFLSFHQFFFPQLDPVQQIEQLIEFNQYWDAYTKLNDMIKSDLNNPHLLGLRSTCELRMLLLPECIADCTKILKLKANNDDLRLALVNRGIAQLQMGNFESAQKDAKSAAETKVLRSITDALRIAKNVDNFMENAQIDDARKALDQLLRICPKAGKYQMMRAEIAWMENDIEKYEEIAAAVIDDSVKDAKYFYRRGMVNFCQNKLNEAKDLLKEASKKNNPPKNASVALNAISNFQKSRNEAEKALANKNVNSAEIAINKTIEYSCMFCSPDSPIVKSTNLITIKLLKLKDDNETIIKVLDEMISKNPSIDLIIERADLHREMGNYDAAIFDYNNVLSQDPGNQRARKGHEEATEKLKQAKHVDYYEILGVSKQASISEIKEAYRSMVRKWHPDRYPDKEQKKKAEAMMKKINTAYEILTDPQRRRMYDQGIDPDDPMSGGGGFDPFDDGFDPFDLIKQTMGGDPFEFMFGGGGGGQAFHIEFNF